MILLYVETNEQNEMTNKERQRLGYREQTDSCQRGRGEGTEGKNGKGLAK